MQRRDIDVKRPLEQGELPMRELDIGNQKAAPDFKTMLIRQVSWKGIKNILASNKEWLAAFQRGGYDFDRKNRKRAEEILIKNFTDKDNNLIFLQWYGEQGQYREILGSIDLLDDPQGFSGDSVPEPAKPLIREGEFSSLMNILHKDHAKLFLHFCPRQFSAKQREALLEISESNISVGEARPEVHATPSAYSETIKNLKHQLQELIKSERKLSRNENKNQKSINQYKAEIGDLRKKNAAQESLLRKYRIEMDDRIEKGKREISAELEKCRTDLAKALESKDDYKHKYDRTIQQMDTKIKESAELKRKINEVKDSASLRFHKILDRVDLRELIQSLNEPDEVREMINSVVRPQTVDEPVPKEITSDELRMQWDNMIKKELDMMEKICRMDICEINNDYYQNWSSHTDDFNDLIYSLRARAVLIKMIHEILWQNKQPAQ